MNIHNLLIEAMRTFSCDELNRFDKFLRSPYLRNEHFNNSKVYELFRMLKSYMLLFPAGAGHTPENKAPSPSHIPFVNWEKVTQKLFPAPTCSEEKQKRLARLCSELICYVLDFFACESFHSRKVDFRISIAQELEKRNLSQLFDHHWKVKYFNGIYNEDEVSNIYHRYQLIRTANLYKEKYKKSRPDYEIELMLFRKYQGNVVSELCSRAEKKGCKLNVD